MCCDFNVIPFNTVFQGEDLTIYQKSKVEEAEALCITGGHVWPASLSLLRSLETLAPSFPATEPLVFVDLSAGLGLVSLGLAKLGDVFALEIPSTISLLQKNVAERKNISCLEYVWGSQIPGQCPERVFLTVACDLLYCAVRDGRERELAQSLAHFALRSSGGILIVWEPRREKEERLLLELAVSLSGGVLALSDTTTLNGNGLAGLGVGSPLGEIFLPPSLFPEAEEDLCVLSVFLRVEKKERGEPDE